MDKKNVERAMSNYDAARYTQREYDGYEEDKCGYDYYDWN